MTTFEDAIRVTTQLYQATKALLEPTYSQEARDAAQVAVASFEALLRDGLIRQEGHDADAA